MNSQGPSSGLPRKELQGSRPPPLKICRDSHKIQKPLLPSMTATIKIRSEPKIIYTQSPKIIHAEVQDFMSLVQRLTGSSSSASEYTPRNSENLKLDNHDQSTIHDQASTATTSNPPAASVENMGMFYTDTVNPDSWWRTEIDSNKEIGIRVSAATSPSIVATKSAVSPFSPNFLFPSPRRNFSQSVFKSLPLMTPNADHLLWNSPRDFYRISESLLISPPQRLPLNSFTIIRSPSPTAFDFYKMNPEY